MILGVFAAAFLAPGLSVQYAEVSIVPPEPLPLGGYTERLEKPFEPGGDDLKARAILFSDGNLRIAVVSAEMLTIPESLYREVAKRIPEDVKLFLSATHTHCAPDSQMLNDRMTFKVPGIASFKQRWLDWYAKRIATAIRGAQVRSKSSMEAFSLEQWRVDLNRARRAEALPPKIAIKLRFGLKASEHSTPIVINHYAAHPVFYGPAEMHTRSDYPGEILRSNQQLEDGLFLEGAIGDVSPKAEGNTSEEQIKNFVNRFNASALEGSPEFKFVDVAPFEWAEVAISLGNPVPHLTFAKANSIPESLAQSIVRRFAPAAANVFAFRLGKLAVVGIPGEPTAALGRRIFDVGRRLGFSWVLVVSHVNGWIGYVLEPADYDRGGYEASLSFNGRETGLRVVEAATRALRKLASREGNALSLPAQGKSLPLSACTALAASSR